MISEAIKGRAWTTEVAARHHLFALWMMDGWRAWTCQDNTTYPNEQRPEIQTPGDLLRAFDSQTKWMVKDAEVRIRVPHECVSQVLGDGRLKSQYESGAPRGRRDLAFRRRAEEAYFGYPPDMNPADRPIYGYLFKGDIRGDQPLTHEAHSPWAAVDIYGDVIARLRADVRARTTFTLSDSLDSNRNPTTGDLEPSIAPQPLLDPTYLAAPSGVDLLQFHNSSGSGRPWAEFSYYVEAQVHGGVRLEDIEEMIFTSTPPTPEEETALKAAGIIVSYERISPTPHATRIRLRRAEGQRVRSMSGTPKNVWIRAQNA